METGLFGKMPAHGDFVRRALPRSFVGPWDAWLSQGIETAREQLGPDWETAWEAAPVWRFRLSPGIFGPAAVVGVIATSCDMVGRRFPLTLAAILPGAAVPPPDAWYALLEAALQAGRDGSVDADALAALLPPAPDDDMDATVDGRSLFWCTGLPARAMPGAQDFIRLLDRPAAPPSDPQPGQDAADAPGEVTPDEAPTLPPGRAAAVGSEAR